MKHKLVGGIKRILLRTFVPLKKKKDDFIGNIRLSIANRIALNYFKLMLINGVLFFFLFQILYISNEKSSYRDLAEEIVINLEANSGFEEGYMNPFKNRGINYVLLEEETKNVVYNDITYPIKNLFGIFKGVHFNKESEDYKLIIEEQIPVLRNGTNYVAVFYYNMTPSYYDMWRLFLNLGLLYLILTFFIIKEAKKNNDKILEPIQAMSSTVTRLTVNNLHSERLNVEGMKNELKDLAVVFNDMLDRLETSYDSQKQFVSDASHELRTPIAVVQGYANMLKRWGSKDEEILEESIEAIQNEAKAMQDLVEKLLFLSRHDKKTLKLEKKHFNMRPVVEEMVKETKLVAENRIVECPCLEDVDVYGDKQSLKQAMRVFIDNAIKYTKDGEKIIISCQNIRGNCVIIIEDTGLGMTRKDVDNIFQRFYRSDQVRNQKIEGHGLGLSIAKLIIMAHTGRIKIRSQYTKGTSFTVTLPRTRY